MQKALCLLVHGVCNSYVTSLSPPSLPLQCLEQLIIPLCKKIPNKALCDVLQQNLSLLYLDISNKDKPKVDASIIRTLAYSCRYLSILKLSDFRVEDPKCLLVLCGKVVLPNSVASKAAQTVTHVAETSSGSHSNPEEEAVVERDQPVAMEGEPDVCVSNLQEFHVRLKCAADSSYTHSSIIFHHNRLSGQAIDQRRYDAESNVDSCVPMAVSGDSSQNPSPMEHQDVSTLMQQLLSVETSPSSGGRQDSDLMCQSRDRNIMHESEIWHPVGQNNYSAEQEYRVHPQAVCCGSEPSASSQLPHPSVLRRFPTREEHENQLARRVRDDVEYMYMQVPEGSPGSSDSGSSESDQIETNNEKTEAAEGDSDEDLYENDDTVVLPLNVEDHSSEFGCLELETLWLQNVNLNDQVCAVLLQSLPNLRDLNLSDTDICNPWRLLEPTCSNHLRLLQYLDVKSTALSRTALEMIPKFHPDLCKFSISSTTLPPHMYANIGKLTGVADLELIGGQFYPCEPAKIFEKGITPAISAIGLHLQSLNLSYFAHVNFEVIVTNCPRIEYLDLSSTSISVSYPCVSLGDCCPQLVSLNLGCSSINAKEKQGEPVSAEKALEDMLGQPKMLEELDLSGLAVTDETIKSMFPIELHPLCVVNLSRCHHVTIVGVQHIWEQCPHLKSIDLSHCRQITLADFQNFEKSCHRSRPLFKQEGKLCWT